MLNFFYTRRKLFSIALLITLIFISFNLILVPDAHAYSNSEDVLKGVGTAILLLLLVKWANELDASAEQGFDYGNYSGKELDLLAHLINGEARGEPFLGQVAVGAVVINRINSPQFPNTMKEVIFQKGQFTCVSDGQFYLKPGKNAYEAAKRALAGEDPTHGALYFYNPRTAKTLWWLEKRPVTVKIGNHVFAR